VPAQSLCMILKHNNGPRPVFKSHNSQHTHTYYAPAAVLAFIAEYTTTPKACSKCSAVKPLTEFYKLGKITWRSRCIECDKEQARNNQRKKREAKNP
jgi:ssDNA-binding Zn-finger/Zn-ribbon topoisomerase 1